MPPPLFTFEHEFVFTNVFSSEVFNAYTGTANAALARDAVQTAFAKLQGIMANVPSCQTMSIRATTSDEVNTFKVTLKRA